MINVIFKSNSNGLISIQVNGHSGFDVSGKDIVCAACSSTVDLTIHTLEEYYGVNLKVEIGDNQVYVEALNGFETVNKLFSSLYDYLKTLSEEYKENIRVLLEE